MKAQIGVIGLGYVGMPLVLNFCEAQMSVIGFDIDPEKVSTLNNGLSHIRHIPSKKVIKIINNGFKATTDFSLIKTVDYIIVCVPTPLTDHREPDLSYIRNTMNSIIPNLTDGQTLILESTTYPGTTEELLCPMIEKAGFKIGTDFFIVYSPEREDPGNKDFTLRTVPKVISGVSQKCLQRGITLYEKIIDEVVPVSSTRCAEFVKLLENTHRAVNIGLINELKILADHMGLDIYETIQAASTKPFGFKAYFPGPGVGGHCIPIDPFYLVWKAKEYGVNTHFIELAGEVNKSMPRWVFDKVTYTLNEAGKPVKGSKILILGLAYKANVDDMRESPALDLMELLRDAGAKLSYSDPHIDKFPRMRRHHFNLKSIRITKSNLREFDCVALLTDHDEFDYNLIAEFSEAIVDTRGKFDRQSNRVTRA